MGDQRRHIALIGNPNCGKSTLFNRLTGLRQNISNLPGTTVEQKRGTWNISGSTSELIDLPGIYSLFAQSDEEHIVMQHLLGRGGNRMPDALVILLDASNLRRNLLLMSQVSELGIPCVVALNMRDTAKRRGLRIDTTLLQEILGTPVVGINARTGEGLQALVQAMDQASPLQRFEHTPDFAAQLADYYDHKSTRGLSQQTLNRYRKIEEIVEEVSYRSAVNIKSITRKFDRYATHKFWGFLILAVVMLTIFQGVFTLANYPMQWIEYGFAHLSLWVHTAFPENFFTNMISGGLIPGVAGVMIFLPQIAFLFLFIGLLEDSGYMVRVSFIMDKLMRKVGLNGRSVIPLVGGFGCAIPSIMATRTIKNPAERLATMFVIPLMSCSARLPVFVLLVSLAVPAGQRFGPLGVQSMVMTGAYFMGIIAAAFFAKILQYTNRKRENSEFIMEMPSYQWPRVQTVWSNVVFKSKSFVTEAGKVIVVISLLLWGLSSYGWGDRIENAMASAKSESAQQKHNISETKNNIARAKLQASYAGQIGQFIEPAIEPLGYDWKTGIALISSFAAREVFVGTMSTLFNMEQKDDVAGIRLKMAQARDPVTGMPSYGTAYAFSLMIFYAFAMQCMSTLAVMRRETGSWKWPMIQFFSFSGLAYVCALVLYQILK